MTTPVYRVRLSPSGKFIGTINAPLQQGPGTGGLAWRKHGTGAQSAVPSTTATSIPSLDAIPVTMKPGYLYDIGLDYTIQLQGITVTASWSSYYRLYNASTSAWGAWVPMINGVRAMHAAAGFTDQEGALEDAAFDVSTTVTCTQIGFGLQSDLAAGIYVLPLASFARVFEYMP